MKWKFMQTHMKVGLDCNGGLYKLQKAKPIFAWLGGTAKACRVHKKKLILRYNKTIVFFQSVLLCLIL
jgi:hypothetical protein